jgi:hypothetical protein
LISLVTLTLIALCAGPAKGGEPEEADRPRVFQAAGPTAASIQGVVDAYRVALGDPNNLSNPGPLLEGRREINWDGVGGNLVTTLPVTPFDVFLDTRGARFTTPGTGLSQGPPTGGPQNGLAKLFENPSYAAIFAAFSPFRLFTPVDSRITEGFFFVPGTAGGTPALVTGFGAIFTDVDRPFLSGPTRNREPSTVIRYFGFEDGDDAEKQLFAGIVPASPGDASQSFFGIVFEKARITRVRIQSGSSEPGANDTPARDVVMMDDFFYGEPQPAKE